MSLLSRFQLDPPFLPDNTAEGNLNRQSEGNSSPGTRNSTSSDDDNMFPDPAEMAPSQPSTRSSTTFAVPFSPRTQHIIKTYGQGVCQKLELPDGSLDEFVKVSAPSFLSMSVHTTDTC